MVAQNEVGGRRDQAHIRAATPLNHARGRLGVQPVGQVRVALTITAAREGGGQEAGCWAQIVEPGCDVVRREIEPNGLRTQSGGRHGKRQRKVRDAGPAPTDGVHQQHHTEGRCGRPVDSGAGCERTLHQPGHRRNQQQAEAGDLREWSVADPVGIFRIEASREWIEPSTKNEQDGGRAGPDQQSVLGGEGALQDLGYERLAAESGDCPGDDRRQEQATIPEQQRLCQKSDRQGRPPADRGYE